MQGEAEANRRRSATLAQAERRVKERERTLEAEQQELDQTREKVGVACMYDSTGLRDVSHLPFSLIWDTLDT